ncbi:MAG: dTMP kinase [Oligoflexales bacterium]
MQTKNKGAFISIEGGEGVGKSLLSDRLAEMLKDQIGIDVIQTREPGGSLSAETIRSLFNKDLAQEPFTVMSELFLVSAARCQHLHYRIVPSLKSGKWVLCDRYTDSTRVYQGILGGMAQAPMEKIIELSTGGLQADLTFLLDCDVETSADRLLHRAANKSNREGGASRYDEASSNTHRKLRAAYLDLAQRFPNRIKVLDANQKPDNIAQQAYRIIQERIGSDGN